MPFSSDSGSFFLCLNGLYLHSLCSLLGIDFLNQETPLYSLDLGDNTFCWLSTESKLLTVWLERQTLWKILNSACFFFLCLCYFWPCMSSSRACGLNLCRTKKKKREKQNCCPLKTVRLHPSCIFFDLCPIVCFVSFVFFSFFLAIVGCKIKALRAKTNTYIQNSSAGRGAGLCCDRQARGCSHGSEGNNLSSRALLHDPSLTEQKQQLNGNATAPGPPNLPGQTTIQVRVPYRVVGLVVGPKGATIKRIQQQTHTYIVTPSRDKEPVFEVTGMPENVDRAREEIEAHISMRNRRPDRVHRWERLPRQRHRRGFRFAWERQLVEQAQLQRHSHFGSQAVLQLPQRQLQLLKERLYWFVFWRQQ